MKENKVAEQVGELVMGKLTQKLNEYKEKKEWNKLFVNTGENFLKEVDCGERIIEDMSALMSKENMKKLAQRTDDESKYNLRATLYRELKKLMLQYEIPATEAEYYISRFIIVILHELEQNDPVTYQCSYLGEWRQNEEEKLAKIREEIKLVNTQLREIQSKKVEVYSLDQVEVELAKQTINPSLDLSFFEIDDDEFQEEFLDQIKNECIYVSGQCKEETIYCVFNELRRLNTGKVIFLVRAEDDWNKLRAANEEHPELGGKILIPWFNAEEIYAIPNNTNIFVYGTEEYGVGKNVIRLRKRKRRTIEKRLESAGMSHESAYALVNDTHGLYIPLKKKIIRGQYSKIPVWVHGEENLIIPLLLCGQWTETAGDQIVLEDLCGRSYDQIVEDINPYLKGEEPLFVRFKVHGQVVYHIASVENAWDYLDDKVIIEDKKWKKYVDCVLEILSEPDPMFDFPEEQQHYAELLPEGKPFWSSTLKHGLLRSMIMKAYYKKSETSQKAIDEVVDKILANIMNVNQWLSIAGYFRLICEISPNAVIRRLDNEWTHPTGLIEVFKKDEGKSLFGKNYYVSFIWGIEQFLLQKEHAAWAVRWMIKMHDLNISYSITNSPKDTLKHVFCSWYNLTVLSQEEKNYILNESFEADIDVWDIVYDELPGRSRNLVDTLCKPTYKITEEPLVATLDDVRCANKEYLSLCLKYMKCNPERWKKIVGIAYHFDMKTQEKIFEHLKYEVAYMSDAEIISVKNVIREEIHRHRYFSSAEWAASEEKLENYELLLYQIQTQNPVYEYQYLFSSDFDFPLLHPCPYSEDEKREINDQLREEEIRTGLLRFKESNLEIRELVSICCLKESSTLGKYLFDIYCDGIFDEELFVFLASDARYRSIMNLYVRAAYRNNKGNLIKAISIAKSHYVDDDLLVNLLLIEEIDGTKDLLINGESDDIKRKYWRFSHRFNCREDAITCRFILGEMMKYSNKVTAIDSLHGGIKWFNPEEIMRIMERIGELETGNITQFTSYSLKEILKTLQHEYINSELCFRVAQFELAYRGLLEWEDMACFKRCLEDSPKLYAEMVSIVYKKDEGYAEEDRGQYDANIKNNIYSLLQEVEFCPAEDSGKVDIKELFSWVEEFKSLLEQQHQTGLFTYCLGSLFASSPIGDDGYYPCESVREAIQQYGDKTLVDEYAVCIFNKRGVFSPTGGNEERALSNKYKENADALRTKYPKVASIYDKLADGYIFDANAEREIEEYIGI